jgi:hypothetical protein
MEDPLNKTIFNLKGTGNIKMFKIILDRVFFSIFLQIQATDITKLIGTIRL